RHLAVRALRAVFVDHVEHDEFGVQSRLSWHGLFSRFLARRRGERGAGLRPEPNDKLQNAIPGSTGRGRPRVKSRSSSLARRTGSEKHGVSERKKPAPVWRRLHLYSANLRGL